MPIPDLSNKPGPGRPGWPTGGSYDFRFKVTGAVTIEAFPNTAGQSFTIKWQDGTTVQTSGSSTINSPAGAGIISINNELDNTYADEFKIVSGQANVTEVISWGNNAWSNVFEAFKDCTNLTKISTTSFLASGQGPNTGQGTYMESMFEGCTSLLEVDITNWNLENGVSWKNNGPFINLANLQKLDATGLKIKFRDNASYSYNAFTGIGTNVATGCEFKLSGLDLSTSPSNYVYNGMFASNKFKDGSNLSGIKWPTALSNPNGDYALGRAMFSSSTILGTLDCSGWTTWNSRRAPAFNSINTSLTSQDGSKVNLSNLNLTSTWNFYNMFNTSRLYEVIGLNTWTASAGGANMRGMFKDAKLMRINPNDNFSSAFTSSLSPTYSSTGNINWQQRRAFYEMCMNFGNLLLDSEVGAPPSFANVNFTDSTLAGPGIFYRFGYGAKLTNTPDLTTAVFSSSVPISFANIFERGATITDTNNHFVLNNQNLKIHAISQAFWSTNIRKITIGNNVDMSAITSLDFMFYASGLPVNSIFLPSNADYSSLATISSSGSVNYFIGGNAAGALSTCQVDTFIRRNRATNSNTNVIADLGSNKITAAPSVARADADYLVNNQSWSITVGSPDTPLPFAYASYAVDPTGITTISPTTTPPAGSVFTATNSLSINSSTGVITINTFRGGTTIRCTYPDGCYNEVQMVIMVPFVLRTIIPANNTEGMEIKPQMSAGECFIDWGDTNSQTVTGNTTHVYASSASDQTYDISIFDSPSGSKFTGFTGVWAGGYAQPDRAANYDKSIMQWGEIEWQNNNWFRLPGNNVNKLRISAPNGAAYKPNLSQVTNLDYMFSTAGSGPNEVFEDVNNNLAGWDTSTILSLNRTFSCIRTQTNRPSDGQPNVLQLSNWDVSNVTNFQEMCHGNQNNSNGRYTNGIGVDVTNWDTSEAVNMSGMFMSYGAHAGIENLNTSKVTNMYQMFLSTSQRYGGYDLKTKIVNGTIRWDVKKVTNFGRIFGGDYVDGSASFTDSTFPTNWYISGEGQDVSMYGMIGNGAYGADKLGSLTNMDAFATKTISAANSPYGTSYTAWDMSKVTSLALFAYTGSFQMSGKNFNISSWQISNKTTTLSSLFQTYRTGTVPYSMDQDIGHWDITNVTAIGTWMENTRTGYGGEVNFSTANYNSLLDITDGWGSQAASVQSGVTLRMGTSKYTAGGTAEQGRTALVNAGWTIVDGGAVYPNTNALSFNGSTEYIDTFYAPDSSLANAFSISAYVKASSIDVSPGNTIIGTYDFTSSRARFYVNIQNTSGAYEFLVGFGSYQASFEISNFTLSQWNHIAVTYDGSNLKLYCNGGSPEHTISLSSLGSLPPLGSYDAHLYIGATNRFNVTQSVDQHWHGDIDEVMLWNTELTQGEIQAYANVIGSSSIPDPNAITGLQLWNRMGD